MIDPATWAGSVPQVGGIAPRVRVGRSRWFNLLWLLPIGFVVLLDPRGRREGPARRAGRAAVHQPVSRHAGALAPAGDDRLPGLGSVAALLQPVLHDLHHPRRHPDPVRPSAAVLDPALHAREGLVSDAETGARGPSVDGEAGLDQPCRGRSVCRDFAIRSDWRAGGTSASTCCGCSNGADLLRPAVRERSSGSVWSRRAGRCSPTPLSVLIQYLSLNWPAEHGWVAYNGLQLIAYFVTVFVAAPLALITGLGMSPALSTRFKRDQQGLQHPDRALAALPRARAGSSSSSCVHVTFVFTTGLLVNLNHVYAGRTTAAGSGSGCSPRRWWSSSSPGSRRRRSRFAIRASCSASARRSSDRRSACSSTSTRSPASTREKDISPYFWHNGKYPDSDEYKALFDSDFADYRLRIDGLVEQSRRAEPRRSCARYRTTSRSRSTSASRDGPASRSGAACRCRPSSTWSSRSPRRSGSSSTPSATGADKGIYYDAHPIEQMSYHLTMLAYDMNGEPLSFGHGAPLRLRNEIAARLQAGEVDQGHRVRRRLLRGRRRLRRLQPRPRVLRLPAIDLTRPLPSPARASLSLLLT